MSRILEIIRNVTGWFVRFWKARRLHRVLIVFIGLLVVIFGSFYGVARWYQQSRSDQPASLGVTFSADHARSLGLDAKQTMDALISEAGVRQFRLVSYWNKHEPQQGTYDFSDLDWQFEKAEQANAKVSLALGLRQPRWPECHEPAWATELSGKQWRTSLYDYIAAVVARYKDSPSLQSYQLENEYYLEAFGRCDNFDTDRLIDEFTLVKSLDDQHPIIMSRSNNGPSLMRSEPLPDIVGVSVYRRVWNETLYKGYFDYPLPSWYYAGIAGLQKIFTGRDSILHEMQMEPWPPSGQFVTNVSKAEQDESMNASMFAGRVQFAKDTGMKQIDLWGAEWWYYRKVVLNDPSLWTEAQKAFK